MSITEKHIEFDRKTAVFRLHAGQSTYAFRVNPTGDLEHLHYGPRLSSEDCLLYLEKANFYQTFDATRDISEAKKRRLERFAPTGRVVSEDIFPAESPEDRSKRVSRFWAGGAFAPVVSDGATTTCKNGALLEFSDSGTGDYRSPSVSIEQCDGTPLSPLTYAGHQIYEGSPDLGVPAQMPRPRVCSEEDSPCSTLVVTMADDTNAMSVHLVYTVFHSTEVIVRKSIISGPKAKATSEVTLRKLVSTTLSFETTTHSHWLTHFGGCWARERQRFDQKVEQGAVSVGSTRGHSGHQHSPFVIISQGRHEPAEEHGNVYGVGLMYSANFLCEAECSAVGRLRVNMGIHPEGFAWRLPQDEVFHTPSAVMAFSPDGCGGLSHVMHSFVRRHVIPPQWRDNPCPVLVNTWEAMYFDVTHDKIVELAKASAAVGIDMVVLDDGWFGHRDDDTSSLGDWTPDPRKFPKGMSALASDVNAAGCSFGLWIEPEMVSPDSNLYRAHPDWVLSDPRRPESLGRKQLPLDMSRGDVLDYLFDSIGKTLRDSNIVYVKWDINRNLSEIHSNACQHQQGVVHKNILGTYELHRRFTEAFPHIRFEGCAGGGGRFDLGILYYTSQIWTSDDNDPQMRMRIQHATSFMAPAFSMGAHYAGSPNDITKAVHPIRTRAIVPMAGTFGYEVDIRKLPEDELREIAQQVKVFKSVRSVIQGGTMYRLWDPFTMPYAAWMYVTEHEALVLAFSSSSFFWSNLAPRLVLRGLDSEAMYRIHNPYPASDTAPSDYELGGKTLMSAGLPVAFQQPADALMLRLTRVGSSDQDGPEASWPATAPGAKPERGSSVVAAGENDDADWVMVTD